MRDGSEPRGTDWDLTAEAPAKLNLGLEVVGRRPDGYHELRTVFQAVDLLDRLRVRGRATPGILLRAEGGETVPVDSSNLVVRAGELLARRRAPGAGAEVLLNKRIPVGAGLGGGSSDAAAALLVLERLWGLDPDPAELARLALAVGSDVPFFLVGGTARGEGRGEILTPLPGPPECGWVLAIPSFRISTPEAFRALPSRLTAGKRQTTMIEIALAEGNFELLAENLVNDLEDGVVRIQPRLATMRRDLLALGAVAVGLSGSGSVMYAVTRSQGDAQQLLERGDPPAGCALMGCRPVEIGARVVSR